MSDTTTPAVVATSATRDEDSALHLDVITEPDGQRSVAVWGTEDSAPDVRLAYTYITEQQFLEWIRNAGYTVAREAGL